MSEMTQDDLERLAKRLCELAERAFRSSIFTFTDFLGLAEQDVFRKIQRQIPSRVKFAAFGGAEGAERVMVRFGDLEELGYEEPYPIRTLCIRPKAPKFAEKLSHRDVLGALMHLGIERSMLGDIVIRDEGLLVYVFAHEKICTFLCESLTTVRNTQVTVSESEDLPEGSLYRTEPVTVKAMSERLDGVIAKVYSLSREEASDLFSHSLVFVEGRCITSPSYVPKTGERISVRTHGRFMYQGYISDTKKGKMNILVLKYV